MIMRVLKGVVISIVGIPLLLIAFMIVIEFVGYFANHAATDRQTKELRNVILQEIDDAEIIDEYSETGNTSGTGNHVDCLSRISFSSDKNQETIAEILDTNYEYLELKSEKGIYIVTLNTSAPFPDNIEGH
ncbi:hypothetical protein SAMN06296386_11228 [Lachnospiraceae bacterium]|nr:hypothetical protein SAMN06296386_11228 [Lachnospiraceae bacterium]